jgi:hypothetical protein
MNLLVRRGKKLTKPAQLRHVGLGLAFGSNFSPVFTKEAQIHQAIEHNRNCSDKPLKTKPDGTLKGCLKAADLSQSHRVSAFDIKKNIRLFLNKNNYQLSTALGKILYQNNPAGLKEYEKLRDAVFEHYRKRDQAQLNHSLKVLYVHTYTSKTNLSLGHFGTNSAIREKMDLNFKRDPKTGTYSLTPRSKAICKALEEKKLTLTRPFFRAGKILSSHVIDKDAPIRHDPRRPSKAYREIPISKLVPGTKKLLERSFKIKLSH